MTQGVKQTLVLHGTSIDSMSNEYRFGLAAMLAPLAVPLTMFTISAVQSGFAIETFRPADLFVVFIVIGVSYGGLLLIGLPAVYWLRRFGILSLWSLSIAGAIGGAIIGFVIRRGFGGQYTSPMNTELVADLFLYFGSLGLIVSLVFGLIARVRLK